MYVPTYYLQKMRLSFLVKIYKQINVQNVMFIGVLPLTLKANNETYSLCITNLNTPFRIMCLYYRSPHL